MAENRAAFILRRLRSLGFSKCRWLRTTFNVPSRSIFFFNRRRAFSTGSPFFSLISVNSIHFLSRDLGINPAPTAADTLQSSPRAYFEPGSVSIGKKAENATGLTGCTGWESAYGLKANPARRNETETRHPFPPHL